MVMVPHFPTLGSEGVPFMTPTILMSALQVWYPPPTELKFKLVIISASY
jgi:hypothetical protein